MKKLFLIALACCFTIVGCKKSDRDDDTSTNSSEDYAFSTGLVYDVFKIVHQASNTSQGIVSSTTVDSTSVFGCDTIIFDGSTTPKTLSINFNNCSSSNSRNGYINASYNGFYDDLGTVTTISFNDYILNDFTFIAGTISYQYNGIVNNFPTYTITFNEVKIRNNQNQKIFYSGSYQLAIIDGEATPLFNDDVYEITGSTTGRVFKGNAFSAQVVDKLTINGNCEWVSSGQALVKPESKTTRTLNFGSSCDNKITVTLYDINYELEMP
ncbi:MAG: hypothetical protein H6587_00850 [Flavobacteriales bacterium]|nr:hypothetical protein [Flavobacteriales bacterium]MCB9363093.1 hypothetical protein [Flavobacteriales bacterium]